MKHLIVGGVAGGATAAARIRRIAEHDEIILFEKGEHISYANCGLPYYIGGTIEDRDKLLVQTPEAFRQRFAIDVRTNSEVTAICPDRKTVEECSRYRCDKAVYGDTQCPPGNCYRRWLHRSRNGRKPT